MDKVHIFKTPGGERMVILPKADYDRLALRYRDEAGDIKAARKVLQRVAAAAEPLVPLEVYKLIRTKAVSRLRAWRTYRGMGSVALAKKLGISPSYLTQIENGTRKGTLKTIAALAAALGTTLDALTD